MAKVKIVTDTGAYLPDADMVARLGIEVVPHVVRVGNQAHQERLNLVDDALYKKMEQNHKSASVESPSLAQMQAIYTRLSRQTDCVVSVHTSGRLSDIAALAQQASKSFVGRHRIIVLDTLTVSAGVGMIVEAAAKAADEGATQAEVVKVVRGMIPHMYALFFSDTLHYLDAWGRLGPAQTILGTIMGMKPLATMEDGDLIPVEKVRSYGRAVDKLYEFIVEFSRIEQMYVVQHGLESEAAQLLERLEVAYPHREFPVIGYSPSLAVHVGPKALGVIVYEGDM